MVSFNSSNLPNSISTIESLVLWGQAILRKVHSQEAVYEAQGEPPLLAATLSPFDIRSADEDWNYTVQARAIGRVSIPLSSDYQTKKIWEAALELGNGGEAIPTEFL